MCDHKNCLNEMSLMFTHNILFEDNIRQIIQYYLNYPNIWISVAMKIIF